MISLKKGDIVFSRHFITGYPLGLSTDSRCVVMQVDRKLRRVLVERDDSRFEGQGWWLDFDSVRKQGGV
jgi:hypothetical protein